MTSLADTETLEGLATRVGDIVRSRAGECAVPGVAIGIYEQGAESYLCHGVTSVANPLEVTPDTLFQIGSVTKTYTATAVMRLVEAGQVDLDAPVRRYLPELHLADRSVEDRVTVLQLLNHTAGWEGDSLGETGNGDDALAKLLEAMATVPQIAPPGTVVSYNNAAFCLAGRLVEKVTGKTYEDAVTTLVLHPLGMCDSFFHVADVITRRFAVGHGNKGQSDGSVEVMPYWAMGRSSAPAGGIASSVRDQLRYALFHLGDGTAADGTRLLSGESLRRMQEPSTDLPFDGQALGIGWWLTDAGVFKTVSHTGGTPSGIANLVLVPERDFAMIVVANSIGAGCVRLVEEIRRELIDVHLGAQPPVRSRVILPPDMLAEYAGTYDRVGSTLTVTVEGDHLVATSHPSDESIRRFKAAFPDRAVPVQPPVPLWPLGDDLYAREDGPNPGIEGSFIRFNGKVGGIRWSGRVARKVA